MNPPCIKCEKRGCGAYHEQCKAYLEFREERILISRERKKNVSATDIYDMDGNVHVAADYLAELFEKYEDAGTTLMVYHGERNAISKAERGEISSYANKILERSAELERLHGK